MSKTTFNKMNSRKYNKTLKEIINNKIKMIIKMKNILDRVYIMIRQKKNFFNCLKIKKRKKLKILLKNCKIKLFLKNQKLLIQSKLKKQILILK